MSKLLPEFPTEWHQEAYIAGLEREIAGYERRQAELEPLGLGKGDQAWDLAASGLEAAKNELARVTGAAEDKPAKKKAAAKK